MKTSIKIENVSKQYRLGLVGTGTLSHDLKRWWTTSVRGKEDPYLKIGETNDRSTKGTSDYIWALKDINLEIEQGDVVGIIGKNGAGKSTLLKLLSRVTKPTTGSIKYNGRIASLLEVGTGFHPEMTGRENIYMNGAIMGMSRAEITHKFDEIVAFAGVERYIDTPVKRYSSGMTVRLGFSIAAHLEPDILVVDEVLAVGDAEFQKKAIGKMQDVSKGGGRTVLFVSHNMVAVQALCKSAILLGSGRISKIGAVQDIIDNYMEASAENIRTEFSGTIAGKIPGNEHIVIEGMSITPQAINITEDFIIELKILNQTQKNDLFIALDFVNSQEVIAFGTGFDFRTPTGNSAKIRCTVPGNLMNDGYYFINLYVSTDAKQPLYRHMRILAFEIKDNVRDTGYLGKINGIVRPKLIWDIL
jgi:lipopolysaccharide transport system ATP-binding protein